jgi:ribosomal protein S18 acetylase RimI-like enzyme
MAVPDHFHEFWRSLDDLSPRVRTTWWGATVTDPRFPGIWDANYARVDTDQPVRAAEIEADLLPELQGCATHVEHIVMFNPEQLTGLISEMSMRGHKVTWDQVMNLRGAPTKSEQPVPIEEMAPGAARSSAIRDSLGLFGVEDPSVVDQLMELEDEMWIPAGKRWFCVRDEDGTVASVAAFMVLGDVAYVDGVATFHHARRRGYATALTTHLCREALSGGAAHIGLLVESGAASAAAIYERIGFVKSGMLASTKGPKPSDAQSVTVGS